jgi:hypothetical protein
MRGVLSGAGERRCGRVIDERKVVSVWRIGELFYCI